MPARPRRPTLSPPPLRRLDVGLAFGTDAAGATLAERRLGTLAESGARVYFEYHPNFLGSPLDVSPLRAPVKPGLIEHAHRDFDWLPGLIADSAPDGWARTIQDRAFAQLGVGRERITILDRLAALGDAGMGALTFRPVVALGDEAAADRTASDTTAWPLDLERIAAQAVRVYNGSAETLLPMLQLGGGSPGGARPKVLAGLAERASGRIDLIAGVTPSIVDGRTPALPVDYVPYLIKFGAGDDVRRFGTDVGAVEQAYAEMARAAGIDMPATRLLTTSDGARHFAIQRFDRFGPGGVGRLHMHTVGGLLHASFREPSLDYRQILQLGARLTRDVRTQLEILRRAAFNVFTHNRDDHARNFAFLMDSTGRWRFSPAYDLTFSEGINGHHTTSVADESQSPTRRHLEQLASEMDVPHGDARAAIDQVIDAVGQWHRVATSLTIAPGVIAECERVFRERRD